MLNEKILKMIDGFKNKNVRTDTKDFFNRYLTTLQENEYQNYLESDEMKMPDYLDINVDSVEYTSHLIHDYDINILFEYLQNIEKLDNFLSQWEYIDKTFNIVPRDDITIEKDVITLYINVKDVCNYFCDWVFIEIDKQSHEITFIEWNC